jgi:hypothetical protein
LTRQKIEKEKEKKEKREDHLPVKSLVLSLKYFLGTTNFPISTAQSITKRHTEQKEKTIKQSMDSKF